MTRALILLFLALSQLAQGHDFYRVNRTFFHQSSLYEVGFFSRKAPWSNLSGFYQNHIPDKDLDDELAYLESRRAGMLRERKYHKDPQELEAFIAATQAEAPLTAHDEIIAIYSWDPQPLWRRELIAMAAVKRLDHRADSLLLLEQAQNVRLERPTPIPVPDNAFYPPHWIPAKHTKLQRWYGDVLQVNAYFKEEWAGPQWIAYLWGMAYWHGILTTGRIIPPGVTIEINDVKITGPAIFTPSHVIGAGYGTRKRLYQSYYDFLKTSVDGKVDFPDARNPTMNLSIMQKDTASIFGELAFPMAARARVAGDFALMHPLNNLPIPENGWQMRQTIHLNPWVEKYLRFGCSWEIMLAEITRSQPYHPELSKPLNARFMLAN